MSSERFSIILYERFVILKEEEIANIQINTAKRFPINIQKI
jgi:hypothetical protein